MLFKISMLCLLTEFWSKAAPLQDYSRHNWKLNLIHRTAAGYQYCILIVFIILIFFNQTSKGKNSNHPASEKSVGSYTLPHLKLPLRRGIKGGDSFFVVPDLKNLLFWKILTGSQQISMVCKRAGWKQELSLLSLNICRWGLTGQWLQHW